MAGRKEYEMLFKLNAELGSSYGSSFNSAKTPVMGLQTEINKLNKAQADISAYQKQQSAVEQTRKKLDMLRQQYDNIQKEMTETGDSSAEMKNKLIAKQNQIDRTNASLQQQTGKLNILEGSLKKAGVSTKDLASESSRLESEIDELKESQEQAAKASEQAAKASEQMDAGLNKAITSLNGMMAALGVTVLLKQFYDVLKASAEAAISFESAMAGVDKTTDMSAAELANMANEFQRMSTVIPVSANELAGIAETAGQLGIAKTNISDFTEVMAKLSTATTMTAQEGATMLAQFANITQMDPANYERLASSVVDLGNNFATTEQKIIDMSQGMAASGSLAGMSEADILGLSAAISSLGIEAQAGATSASKLITELDKSVKTGKGIQDFARIAGMAGNDFAKAWGEDAAGALALFITGLNDTERHGKSATVILEEMGITEVRLQRMMLSLAGSGDLMNRAIETSNQAWRDNTALQDEANKRYGTTESKVEMAKNAFENLKVTLGEHLTPIIGAVAEKITEVVTGITTWMDKNPELTQAILTMGGILLIGMGAITAYTAVVKLGTAAMGLFTAAIPGIGWVLGGIAALALLGGAFVLLKSKADEAAETFPNLDKKFDESMKVMSENSKVLDLADEYTTLSGEIEGGKTAVEEYASAQNTLWESWKSGDISTKEYEDKLKILRDSYGSSLTGVNDYSQKEQELWDSWQSGDISIASYQKKLEELRGYYGLNFNEADEYRKKEQELWDSWTSGDISTDEYKDKLEGLRTQYGENLSATEEFRAKEDELWQALITGKIPIDEYTQELDKIRAKYSETQGSLKDYQEKQQALWDAYQNGTIPTGEYQEKLELLRKEYTDGVTAVGDYQAKEDELWKALIGGKIHIDEYTIEMDKIRAQHVADGEAAAEYQEKEAALWEAYTSGKTSVGEYSDKLLALRTEYGYTILSADDLAGKQARLSQIKQELRDKSGGLITATDEETEAFGRQVAALETIIKMEQDQARAAAYENLTKQSKAYTDAIRQEQQSSADLATAQAKQQEVVSIIGDGYESATEKARQLIRSIIDVRNSDFGETDRAKAWDAAAVKEVETLLYTLTGESRDFKANLGNAWYVLENMGKDDTNFRKSWNEANDEVARYQGEVAEAQKVQSEFLQNLVDGFMIGGISMEEYETMLTETFSKYENGAQIVSDIMDEIRSRTQLSADATNDLGNNMEDAATQALAIEDAAQRTKAEIDKLAAAYDKAYDSAYSSISGQLKLFEDLKKVDKEDVKSADQMLKSLNEQAAYLETYNANLQKAKEMGVAQELVSQLSDGSVESATHLQTIVNSSAEKIGEINAAFEKVSEGKDAFASTVAEMETDFSTKMAALQQELVTKVNEMNLQAEAAESGKQTIAGLIKGAEGMKSQLAAAYARVAQAAIDAINAKMKIQSPSKVMEEISAYNMQGLVIGAEKNQESYANAMREAGQAGVDAYQSIDLLDALGPGAFERDGRIFLTATQPTEAVNASIGAAGNVIQLEVNPVYHITGNASPEAVRDTLAQHNDGLRELVLDIVAEAGIDQKRRSYDG